MEAIIESLKDMELRQPQEILQSNVDTASNDQSSHETEASTLESNGLSSKAVGSTISASSISESSEIPGADTARLSLPAESSTLNDSMGGEDTSDSAQSSACGSSSNQPDANTADGMRATLVVQKNPSSHIMEGLAHRWRLNFFKSGR